MKPEEIAKKIYPESKNNGENHNQTPDQIAEQAQIDSYLAVRNYKRNHEIATVGWVALVLSILFLPASPAQVITIFVARKAEKLGREFESAYGKKSKNVRLAYFSLFFVILSILLLLTDDALHSTFQRVQDGYNSVK